jgi:peroxiredoxin
MLAVVKTSRYPSFDASEIDIDQEYSFKPRHAVSPIKTGDIAPDFVFEKDSYRWQQFFNGVETHGPVLFRQLLNKTLVIAFYSNSWQAHGLDQLKHLNAIQDNIRANDANLLIISTENGRRLEKLAWDNNLSLSFYFDPNKEIAEKFGVYTEDDPVWNRFSGIDTNVPLLATYVIASYGRILYDHIDLSFSKDFPSKEIISALSK